MVIQFIDRDSELEFLNKRFKSGSAEFIPIYGRRRVGKTELILEFIKDKPAVYFPVSIVEEKENLKKVSELLGEFFNDTALKLNHFETWDKVFVYLAEKTRTKRFIFAIDEFPYLAKSKKYISSIFQTGWDQYLKDTKIFLILCGSSVGMMYKEILAYKAPLYGRRTGQIELKSMTFMDSSDFFPKYSFEDKIMAYTILGGVPAYLKTFDDKLSIKNNIKGILDRNHALFDEPEILVKEELREPAKYMTILKAIAFGKTKMNEISNYTEIERTTLFKYLTVLERLGFIEKSLPSTEKQAHKSKKGLYFLRDEFLAFWFKFMFPFKAEVESGRSDVAFHVIERDLNQHIGHGFEEICRQVLWNIRPIEFNKLGRWWHKDKEIDLIGLNEEGEEIIFVECKWQDNVNPEKILVGLKEKAKYVDWNIGKRKEYYCVIAKSFSKKIKEDGIFLFDLKDLEKALK